MIRSVKICFFFFLLAHPVFGQNAPPVYAWFESETFEGKKVIRAWCRNESAAPLHLKYRAELFFQEKKEVREGSFLASPTQNLFLEKAVFILPAAAFDSVRLVFFYRKKLVFETRLLREPPQKKMSIAEATPLPVPKITPPPKVKTPQKNPPSSAFDAEIDGLVLDETRSKLAHDFYELFYNYWSTENISTSGHTLTIREMPARIGIGSQVVVEVDGKRLTTLNLQPRAEVIENLAKQLTSALVTHFQDPNNFLDLDSNDLNGSGIY